MTWTETKEKYYHYLRILGDDKHYVLQVLRNVVAVSLIPVIFVMSGVYVNDTFIFELKSEMTSILWEFNLLNLDDNAYLKQCNVLPQ